MTQYEIDKQVGTAVGYAYGRVARALGMGDLAGADPNTQHFAETHSDTALAFYIANWRIGWLSADATIQTTQKAINK